MTQLTDIRAREMFHRVMNENEIVVASSWREKLELVAGSRKQTWAVISVVGAVTIGALGFWMKGAPAEVAPPAVATPAPEAAITPSAASPAAAEVVLVHVAGAVRRPGLYEFPAGARVADAIDAAGGPLRTADLDLVNLAQVLTDAVKLDVPRRGETVPAVVTTPTSTAGTPSAGPGVGGPVSLNAADQSSLEAIPGIGPVKASAILEYRDQAGGFSSVEELLDVTGIGPATLEAIRPYVTL